MKILMTGASSFTGAYIAQAYLGADHEVVALLTRDKGAYSNAEYQRRFELCKGVRWIENQKLGSESFFKTIQTEKPDAFVNHGAPIDNYRSPDFDFLKSVSESLHEFRRVAQELKLNGCQRFIHTGTCFEPNDQRTGASIYGVSKRMVWEVVRFYVEEQKIPLVKIEIPNPIGPLENPSRLIPVFCDKWKKGEVPNLGAPNPVGDHLPASWLARRYVEALDAKIIGAHRVMSPSGFVLSNLELVELFLSFAKRMGVFENAKYTVQNADAPATVRQNIEPCPELDDDAEIVNFFQEYVSSLK